MSDQHDDSIRLSIDRAMTRTRKGLQAANLDRPQIDVVMNVMRDVIHTVLEEIGRDVVRELVLRDYHGPDECHLYAGVEEG